MLAKQETVSLPYELMWRDVGNPKEKKAYYRVKASVNSMDHLVSNPIFVKFSDSPVEMVASLPESTEQLATSPDLSIPAIPKPSLPQNIPIQPPTMQKISGAKTIEKTEVSSITMPEISSPIVEQPVVNPPKQPIPPAGIMTKTSSETVRFQGNPKKLLKVVVDGVALRKGPGTVFPKITNLNKGAEIEFVRRTKIEFNNKNWLVVKRGNRSAYIWEGVVQWAHTSKNKK